MTIAIEPLLRGVCGAGPNSWKISSTDVRIRRISIIVLFPIFIQIIGAAMEE
jgi:hypothetical protein